MYIYIFQAKINYFKISILEPLKLHCRALWSAPYYTIQTVHTRPNLVRECKVRLKTSSTKGGLELQCTFIWMSIKQTKNTALRLPVIRTTFRSKFGMSVIYQREITLTLFASQTVFFFFQSNFSLINSLNILSSYTTLGKCHVQMAEWF